MRRIAARSGVSVPAIYGHYESKQAILVRILDDASPIWSGAPRRRWPKVRTHRTGSAGPWRTSHCSTPTAAGSGFIAASEVRALVGGNREAITARRNRQQEIVDELVHEAVALGVFTTTIPDDAARVVVSMRRVAYLVAAVRTIEPEAVATEYVDFALALVGYR